MHKIAVLVVLAMLPALLLAHPAPNDAWDDVRSTSSVVKESDASKPAFNRAASNPCINGWKQIIGKEGTPLLDKDGKPMQQKCK